MIIENDLILVEVNELGAEITRIYDKENKTEILWDGNPKFWKRHSPILFPNVGKNFRNKVLINGKIYENSQHGFARDNVFKSVESSENKGVFKLEATEETKKDYPFDFRLTISYEIKDKDIHVNWKVENTDSVTIPFTIGGHPAFMFKEGDVKTDYVLKFPGKKQLDYILLDKETGTALPDKVYQLELEDETCPLNDEMFENDALVFDNTQIEEVWLCYKDGRKRVGMLAKDFPNYGIWSVKDAPFVCLEPWVGRCDNYGFDKELATKPGINLVEPKEKFQKEYTIKIG